MRQGHQTQHAWALLGRESHKGQPVSVAFSFSATCWLGDRAVPGDTWITWMDPGPPLCKATQNLREL